MTKILVICAHPDDETLGLGGTLSLHAKEGDEIQVLVFSEGETARGDKAKVSLRQTQAKKAALILGIKKIEFLGYPDQKLDSIPTLELTQQIEKVMRRFHPTMVFTHYGGDVNQDHRKVFEATTIAVRPLPGSKVKQLICYETPSSTEWANKHFEPNFFVDITNFIKTKNRAVKKYKHEIRPSPHPRSEEALINRARYWGSNIGKKYAEAFLILRWIK